MRKIILITSTIGFASLYFTNCNSGNSSDSSAISTDSITIAHGKASFENKCASCHNFSGNGIGPQLAGITLQQPIEWIKGFIKNPKKVIDAGDTTAQKLFKEYKAAMPSFDYLSNEEIDALIAFIGTQKKLERKFVPVDTNDIKNPIADAVESSGLMVDIALVTQIPPSSSDTPVTRITKLDYQPNNGNLYVIDLRGKLYKLQNGQPSVYMDIAALRSKFINQPGTATGFGSFAFHPEFSKNGLLYTTNTEGPGSGRADFTYPDSIPVMLQWVLTEWKTKPEAFPFSGIGREVFRINFPTGIHGVQEIAFNRFSKPGDEDYGLLYIGIGDGGSAEIGSPLVSPVPGGVWGSIIRIDPSGHNSVNGQYGIPAHNPFATKDSTTNAREIYAWGFRNPHRMSWSKSKQLFAVNIGEHNIEALNMIVPGHFYGWPVREGIFVERFFNDLGKVYPLPSNDSVYHITYPVAELDHDECTAISGGFEYQGAAIPKLAGKFLFGDIGTGRLFFVNMKDVKLGAQATVKKWNISVNGSPTTLTQLCKNSRVEMRFGMDSRKELYILTKADGKIYRLVGATMK